MRSDEQHERPSIVLDSARSAYSGRGVLALAMRLMGTRGHELAVLNSKGWRDVNRKLKHPRWNEFKLAPPSDSWTYSINDRPKKLEPLTKPYRVI